ncbi:unnamed protein product [Thlaspi arvense]|uniref:Uncharacterized protein n=1 Tax=Thlaspi arvense TaxID=13288 RepID=A0AAU9RNB9_THLAR|nr:unnamed protein product [Thlaspi arvense]
MDGTKGHIEVIYPWLPPQCNICQKWSHLTKYCPEEEVRILQSKPPEMSHAFEVVEGLLKELETLLVSSTLGTKDLAVAKEGETSKKLATVEQTPTEPSSCIIVVKETGIDFMCSVVYTFNFESDKRNLWDEVRATENAYAYVSVLWILLGDFNEALATSEHSMGYDQTARQVGMCQFQNLVAYCSLPDLPAVGSIFTWWNKITGDPVGKKLDKALVNGLWLQSILQSYANFETGGISGHARYLIRLVQQKTVSRKPIKFCNYLTDHQRFIPTVKQVWHEHPPTFHSRAALYRFHKQLKSLKFGL